MWDTTEKIRSHHIFHMTNTRFILSAPKYENVGVGYLFVRKWRGFDEKLKLIGRNGNWKQNWIVDKLNWNGNKCWNTWLLIQNYLMLILRLCCFIKIHLFYDTTQTYDVTWNPSVQWNRTWKKTITFLDIFSRLWRGELVYLCFHYQIK